MKYAEWHSWMRLRRLEHLHREIILEQQQLSVAASLFLSPWFDAQEGAELEAGSQQHLPRAPGLLDPAPTSPGQLPAHTALACCGAGGSSSPSRGNPLLWEVNCIGLGSAQMSKKHHQLQHPLINTPGVQNLLFHLTATTRHPATISVTDNQIPCLPSLY